MSSFLYVITEKPVIKYVIWKTRNNPRHRSKSNIKVYISEVGCEAVD
jgi:hypothetical protein